MTRSCVELTSIDLGERNSCVVNSDEAQGVDTLKQKVFSL